MANFEIPTNPEYTEQIRKFETKDPAHADLFNSVIGVLLNNDVFLKLAIDAAFRQSTGYTDQQITDLINGAPETLNTLGEIAEAMKNNSDVVDALNAAIGTKANQAEVDGHIGNDTIHIKASERQNWNEKQTKTGDVQDNIVTFESGDAIEPTGWANVALVTTKEKMSSLMRKLSLTVKNMRYLFKLIGNTQLSVGDGTITGAINELNTGLGGIKNFNIILQGTDNDLLNDLALTWPNIPNGSGMVSLGNESTVYSGTYVKFSDVLGSITFENATGVLYTFNVDFPKGTAHLYSSNWKYLGCNSGNCGISLPEHREIYIAVDFQSQSNNARTLLIPNIRSFEVDLYGQINGVTDYVRIYYHQSVVGMYQTSNPAGIENFKLSVWYR